jgi:hypothetical protein
MEDETIAPSSVSIRQMSTEAPSPISLSDFDAATQVTSEPYATSQLLAKLERTAKELQIDALLSYAHMLVFNSLRPYDVRYDHMVGDQNKFEERAAELFLEGKARLDEADALCGSEASSRLEAKRLYVRGFMSDARRERFNAGNCFEKAADLDGVRYRNLQRVKWYLDRKQNEDELARMFDSSPASASSIPQRRFVEYIPGEVNYSSDESRPGSSGSVDSRLKHVLERVEAAEAAIEGGKTSPVDSSAAEPTTPPGQILSPSIHHRAPAAAGRAFPSTEYAVLPVGKILKSPGKVNDLMTKLLSGQDQEEKRRRRQRMFEEGGESPVAPPKAISPSLPDRFKVQSEVEANERRVRIEERKREEQKRREADMDNLRKKFNQRRGSAEPLSAAAGPFATRRPSHGVPLEIESEVALPRRRPSLIEETDTPSPTEVNSVRWRTSHNSTISEPSSPTLAIHTQGLSTLSSVSPTSPVPPSPLRNQSLAAEMEESFDETSG